MLYDTCWRVVIRNEVMSLLLPPLADDAAEAAADAADDGGCGSG